MTLFELQEWLGHRTPEATTHYAKLTPNTLARAYNDAGYFARNVRTIEVLVDRDAVTSGTAANGEPWQYFDLGHGACTYTFFEQCQHRMACARCDFYTLKDSSEGQLLEAKENPQKTLASIPLTDDERAAVDDGQAALDQLLERLTDVPTPAGPTPRRSASQPPRHFYRSTISGPAGAPAPAVRHAEVMEPSHDRLLDGEALPLPEPWIRILDSGVRNTLEAQLKVEVGEEHPLFGKSVTALARCGRCDEALFGVGGAPTHFAQVHLTWRSAPDTPPWPWTEFLSPPLFDSLADHAH
ncbi:hypothetical protein [Streptomyces antimycoticus]|uniref:hypothetical protein n=1 Tax=Streptomyces antimycoticus TaxID=68175 RepID=UPI001F489147|nr:hypothetical protein [Streptomyces antimycoticus]